MSALRTSVLPAAACFAGGLLLGLWIGADRDRGVPPATLARESRDPDLAPLLAELRESTRALTEAVNAPRLQPVGVSERAQAPTAVGGAPDPELVAAIREEMVKEKVKVEAVSHPDSIYAGAIGAALWGAYRHEKLKSLEARQAA